MRPWPAIVRTYGGDVLSATCIFFGARFAIVRARISAVAAAAFVVCVLIELQQLIRARWLVRLRDDTPLGIVLGHGFLWSDIAAYAVGVALGAMIALPVERPHPVALGGARSADR